MASHYVAIAKASLAASLLRPDPLPVSRDEIGKLHKVLDEAILHCSPSNIQKCKEWLLDNIVPSSGRLIAFGKYLAAWATSFDNPNASDAGNQKLASIEATPRKKRLHVLYLLNDILHHTKYHMSNPSSHSLLTSALQTQLVHLVTLAASFDISTSQNLYKRLQVLLKVWQDNKYYTADYIDKLREAAENAHSTGIDDKDKIIDRGGEVNGDTKSASVPKEPPYMMPPFHGDPSIPYYDLPAGNMLPHIVPNSTLPINEKLMKPLQFVAGPPEDYLKRVVKDFLDDIASIYYDTRTEDEGVVPDIDDMGQPLAKDEITGEFNPKEGYYGWSVSFCERMKKRKFRSSDAGPRNRSSDRGRSLSVSQSPSPRRRREYSSSYSSRKSRSRSPRAKRRERQRSYNRSRSRSRRSPPCGRERSRSRSPRRPFHQQPPFSSKTDSQLPPHQLNYSHSVPQPTLVTPVDQIDNPIPSFAPPAPPQLNQLPHDFPLGPNGLPIPPPPPFHSGPWPPSMPQNVPTAFQSRPSLPTYGRSHLPDLRGFLPPPLPPNMSGGRQGPDGGLASPMPLWPSVPGHGQSDIAGVPLGQQMERNHRSKPGSYEQTPDPRRR